MWTKKDRLLLNLINEFGKQSVRKQAIATAKAYANADPKPAINEFGTYDPATHIFRWQNDMNHTMLDMVRNHYISIFGSDETLNKLFRHTVHLNTRDQFVIPYLMDILNAAFHVIRFRHGTIIVYGLIKLDVPNMIDFERFEHALLAYRMFSKRSLRRTKKRRM
jgi:hypothetical protein